MKNLGDVYVSVLHFRIFLHEFSGGNFKTFKELRISLGIYLYHEILGYPTKKRKTHEAQKIQ